MKRVVPGCLATGRPARAARGLLRAAALACLAVGSWGASAAAQEPPRNVVLIVADDLGWADVGWHADEMRTPVLDALVREGVELDRHYVQPQCTPTRVALLTGRYPSRFGDHCTTASNEQAFAPGTPTLAHLAGAAGLASCLTGKWHLGSRTEWGPQVHGFDHAHGSLAGAVGMYDHRYRLDSPYARTWQRNGEFVDEVGHAADLCTDEAVGWIEDHVERPFFLYVPFHSVHVPLVEEQRWIKQNRHIDDPDRRLFAAAVSHLDACVGRIVRALDEARLREDTLLVFLSDNGGLRSHAGGAYPPPDTRLETVSSNAPLRGFKVDVFEGGIRVPAFVNWPGRLGPGVCRQVIHAVDWMPTLARLFGAPADPAWDGLDVWDALADVQRAPEPRRLYWKWSRKLALLDDHWKLLRNRGDGPFMLFDLADDPGETRDLAAEEPERLAALLGLLRAEVAADATPIDF